MEEQKKLWLIVPNPANVRNPNTFGFQTIRYSNNVQNPNNFVWVSDVWNPNYNKAVRFLDRNCPKSKHSVWRHSGLKKTKLNIFGLDPNILRFENRMCWNPNQQKFQFQRFHVLGRSGFSIPLYIYFLRFPSPWDGS